MAAGWRGWRAAPQVVTPSQVSRTASFALFLLIATVLVGGIHGYLWLRLVRDTALSGGWRRALGVTLVLAALALPAGMFALRALPQELSRVLAPLLFGWMGASFLLFAALVATDAVRLLAAAWSWASTALGAAPDAPQDPSRRAFVARAAAGAAVAAAGTGTALAVRTAVDPPLVREVPVRLEKLPRALSGLTIAQISDLHVGYTIGAREVRRVVEMTNDLRPDVVAITGDLVDGTVDELRAATSQLARLSARFGVYFVTGNHEYYSGVRDWVAELRRYGVRVLRNERVVLGDTGAGGATIDLAGVDDHGSRRFASGGADLARAVQGRDPDRALVLLAHQPRGSAVADAVRRGVDLQLSGHTHGGQIFPWTFVVGAFFPYLNGLYRHAEDGNVGQVYVSPGTGYWGPPMRLGVPPEIAKVVLTR
jgi:predicted MPP superfamily phosphohydrolase